jgi:hypothetical protein
MTTPLHPADAPKPFALPLQAGDYGDDIVDNSGTLEITLYGDERAPETRGKRDYVIGAVNSYPLLEEMREAAKLLVKRHEDIAKEANFSSCGCSDCAPFRSILAEAEAVKP